MEKLKLRLSEASTFNALKDIHWRLRGPQLEFVGVRGGVCAFVPENGAIVFNGLDNEDRLLRIYEWHLGPLSIELLD